LKFCGLFPFAFVTIVGESKDALSPLGMSRSLSDQYGVGHDFPNFSSSVTFMRRPAVHHEGDSERFRARDRVMRPFSRQAGGKNKLTLEQVPYLLSFLFLGSLFRQTLTAISPPPHLDRRHIALASLAFILFFMLNHESAVEHDV
jgi:hypothetical protein